MYGTRELTYGDGIVLRYAEDFDLTCIRPTLYINLLLTFADCVTEMTPGIFTLYHMRF